MKLWVNYDYQGGLRIKKTCSIFSRGRGIVLERIEALAASNIFPGIRELFFVCIFMYLMFDGFRGHLVRTLRLEKVLIKVHTSIVLASDSIGSAMEGYQSPTRLQINVLHTNQFGR